MSLFAISGFLIGILCSILGVITLIKGRRFFHYIWGLFSFSVALWGFGSYKIATAMEPSQAIFWWRIAYVGVILIPVLITHFVHRFLDIKGKWFIRLIYFIVALFLFFDFYDGLFIREVRFLFGEFYYLSSPPILYTIFVIFFGLLVLYFHARLGQEYKKSVGIKKAQIKYLIIATFIGFYAGVFEFLPVYKISIYPYLHFLIAISPLLVSYAILKYRLMDIRIIIRRFVVYAGMTGLVYGTFYLVVWLYDIFLGSVFSPRGYFIGLIIAPTFVGIFVLANKYLKGFANKYLFSSLYNYQEAITELADKLNESINLDKIANLIVDTIKSTMRLDRAGVLLVNNQKGETRYQIAKVIGFNETNGISLVQDNFLTRYLQKTKGVLIREELLILAKEAKKLSDKENFKKLEKNMERIEASLCLPLISGSKLIGIIVLGSKLSGDAYSNEDLNLLDVLSKQASIALENARLYKEVQDLSQNLQKKVDEQTEKIRKAYEVEKQARKSLEKMNEAKNQFIMATQHHLRTPLTSMSGYLDLLLNGTYGKIPKKIKEVLEKFNSSTANEIKIVNDLLDISQFQMGKQVVFPREKINIEEIIKEAIDDVELEADKKEIFLKLETEKNLPQIHADPQKLKVAICNIIDNAVKYTQKGGVSISINSNSKETILIAIKDTGAGIPKEYQEGLFNKLFERGEGAMKMFATGRGIGLWITSRIIDGHNGKIWVESEGVVKGTTFFIELPINS